FDIAIRHGWPLSVAFIDLDDFKRVNDGHGHLVGDEVLRNFAQSLQRLLRSSDTVARFGGEEFVVLLRVESLADLELATERLRKAIRG
ncbi:GGDEF domain-containing protein, partial [Peribacillus sp. SIMBA_075]|uniref:GGDEF domain-containing protein n=1 Tax=Peribacillus sp. SIMBA_075 TaxID=3085813 RepID=UPI00397BCC10